MRSKLTKIATLLILFCTAVFAQQKGTFTDPRDKKAYKTTKIGKQTWMAENLNYNAEGSACYDDKPANCQKFGRLYKWETAMKACPAGWHLPYDVEWDILMDAVGGVETAGTKLKAKSGWFYEGKPKGNGEDKYGFSALPTHKGGVYSDGSGMFYEKNDDDGRWWSASEFDALNAYFRAMSSYPNSNNSVYGEIRNKYDDGLVPSFHDKSETYLSVRCLKDEAGYDKNKMEAADTAAVRASARAAAVKAEGEAKAAKAAALKAEEADKAAKATAALAATVTKGSFADARDKKNYKTTKIGEQTWMAENLNYAAKSSKCYGEDGEIISGASAIQISNAEIQANCQKYGRLYDWNTAKSACPSGWHLPSKGEWEALINTVVGAKAALTKLAAKGTDDFGFSSLPGGQGYYRDDTKKLYFIDIGKGHKYWSATEIDSQFGWIFENRSTLSRYEKNYLLSVRCLKN